MGILRCQSAFDCDGKSILVTEYGLRWINRGIARDGGRRLIADIWRKLTIENRGQVVGTAAFFGRGFIMVLAYLPTPELTAPPSGVG